MDEKKIISPDPPRWVRGPNIGVGGFSMVSLAKNVSDGRIFAVKSVISNTIFCEYLEKEIQLLRSLSSPYVIQYLGDDLTLESHNVYYRNLHMEYMPGGTATDVAAELAKLPFYAHERIVSSYARCILSALSYIHDLGFVHCDLKGVNVLLGPTPGIAKLADFGLAKRFSGDGVNLDEEGEIVPRGTPQWRAPEVTRRERQGPESDVWSFGLTVIEMFTGKPTLKNCGGYPDSWVVLSEQCRDFLDKCLRKEPSERWSCDQLLSHPFIVGEQFYFYGTIYLMNPPPLVNFEILRRGLVHRRRQSSCQLRF